MRMLYLVQLVELRLPLALVPLLLSQVDYLSQ